MPEIRARSKGRRQGRPCLNGARPVIASARLQQLVGLMDQQRETIDDPELSAVLDEIDLRARVELAKLEVSGLI